MKKTQYLVLLVITVALVLTACSGARKVLDPPSLIGSLDELDSYRQEMQFDTGAVADGGQSSASSERLEVSLLVDNLADMRDVRFRISLNEADATVAEQGYRLVYQGELVYIELPELGCVMLPASDIEAVGAPSELLPSVDALLALFERADLEKGGQGEVNGRTALPYVFDQTDLATDVEGVTALNGSIHVDEAEGFPLRLVMEGTGAVDFLVKDIGFTGPFHLQVDILDVNNPIAIELPDNCDPMVLP